MPQSPGKTVDHRDKYIAAALHLFAAKGVDGTAIAAIATATGLTKQAMLHHFGSKDGLYAAVLNGVAQGYENLLSAIEIETQPANRQLALAMEAIQAHAANNPDAVRLIQRALMENDARAQKLRAVYLGRFLQQLTDMALEAPHWRGQSERDARAGVFLLLGALNTLATARSALAHGCGEDVPGGMADSFARGIAHWIASPPEPRV